MVIAAACLCCNNLGSGIHQPQVLATALKSVLFSHLKGEARKTYRNIQYVIQGHRQNRQYLALALKYTPHPPHSFTVLTNAELSDFYQLVIEKIVNTYLTIKELLSWGLQTYPTTTHKAKRNEHQLKLWVSVL